jgi:hypothetical protein
MHPPSPEVYLLAAASRMAHDDESVARLRETCAKQIHWATFVDAAAAHGTMAIAYSALRKHCTDAVPPEVMDTMAEHATMQAVRSLVQLAELGELLRMFEDTHLIAVPFKGPVLAWEAYRNTAIRRSSDLDFLIRKADCSAALSLMNSLGFKLETPIDPAGVPVETGKYEYHFAKPDATAVEIRWRATQQQFSASLDLDFVLPRSARRSLQGIEYVSLAPEDVLLILCAHGAKHQWERLAWICDIVELVRRHPNLDWDATLSRARQLGLKRITNFGLILAADLLDGPIPASVLKSARKDAEAAHLAEETAAGNKSDPRYHLRILDSPDLRRLAWRWRVEHYVARPALKMGARLRALASGQKPSS